IEDAYQSRIDGLGKYSRMCVVGDCFGTANQGRTCAQHCNGTPVSNPTTPTISTPVTAPATSSCEKISPTNNPSEISSYNKSNLNLSQSGVEAIAAEEAVANCMYQDSSGYATVGIGHLLLPRGTIANLATKAPSEFEKYRNGMTDSEAYALKKKDVEERVKNVMVSKIKVKLNPCQMDALISLAFNVGPGAPQSVYNLINECNFEGAADEFLKYNKAKEKVLPGLTARRQREREIFLN
ncbi:MAG: lysozyme, partial [Acidithiobacillus sp.]|nr:lysozyme [Acidithiobacillus sp.]